MNSLEFNHFRKFQHFSRIEFGNISFLVGANNSGKSTFVKALVLIEEFLKSDNWSTFNFNNSQSENVNFITYSRALNKNTDTKIQGNYIDFKYQIKQYEFYLKITSNPNNTIADVLEISLIDLRENFKFSFFPKQKYFVIENNSQYFKDQRIRRTDPDLKQLELLEQSKLELTKLREAISTVKDTLSSEYVELIDESNKLSAQISFLNKSLHSSIRGNQKELESLLLTCDTTKTNPGELFEEIVTTFLSRYDVRFAESQKKKFTGKKSEEFSNLRYFYQNRRYFESVFTNVLDVIANKTSIYLPAVAQKQYALLPARDKSNQLAQAIFNYAIANLDSNENCVAFINTQLRKFEIGQALEIIVVEGDYCLAEIVQFTPTNNQAKANKLKEPAKILISDLGMGSIQLVKLILQLAVLIFSPKKNDKEITVIIEEPEMNLHPKLQSLLCDLFYEVSEYGIQIIAETHSEYLVRKTQLIVKQHELKIEPNLNPFSVIYFNNDNKVWNMEYREDGKFKNEFGSGFFDETRNIVKQML
ncbi:AAA family ATPase [Kaistella carnis]|uniref:AAA family ATPase n=1 Tax=Kaistella carnis TaxID=1241979 RepID=UPI00289F3F07|nr:AAA family ATPase [Kaistella carnis]